MRDTLDDFLLLPLGHYFVSLFILLGDVGELVRRVVDSAHVNRVERCVEVNRKEVLSSMPSHLLSGNDNILSTLLKVLAKSLLTCDRQFHLLHHRRVGFQKASIELFYLVLSRFQLYDVNVQGVHPALKGMHLLDLFSSPDTAIWLSNRD